MQAMTALHKDEHEQPRLKQDNLKITMASHNWDSEQPGVTNKRYIIM